MIEVCPKNICTGCALCVAQCPKSCIKMHQGFLGHLFPVVDQNSCIDCGLCQKKCPSLRQPLLETPKKVFAGWAKDIADYKTSTSGAAASLLSHLIINQGGVVYGCSMLADVNVKHIRIDKLEKLFLLKGSKYVQSNIEEVIPQLKKDVKEFKKTLFIGTPCQVAAIRNIYNSMPENLFLVDIICHGVPSLNMLQHHVCKVAPFSHYDNIVFREGNIIIIAVVVDGKEVYRKYLFEERFKDVYLNAFFDGFTYRNCCYSCQYACQERVSDITIGDYWGLGAELPLDDIPEHNDGCSAILVNTDKGNFLLDEIRHKANLYERPLDECVKGNEQLRHPKLLGPRIKAYRTINKLFRWPKAYYLVNLDLIMKTKFRNKRI